MSNRSTVSRVKIVVMIAAAFAGGTAYTSCGMSDIRDNLVAGTLTYVKSATTEMWTSSLPKWSDIVKQGQGT
jgi:hypothetical protein